MLKKDTNYILLLCKLKLTFKMKGNFSLCALGMQSMVLKRKLHPSKNISRHSRLMVAYPSGFNDR